MRAALFFFLTVTAALLCLEKPVAEEEGYRLAWRFVTGGRIVTKPAVDHLGTIYALSDDRVLYAISPVGKERWRFPVGGKASAGPVITYDGTVLVGTRSGILLAAGPNGRLRWSFAADSGACLTPAVARDGSIVLSTESGTIYCLTYTGRERWRYRLRAEIRSSPSIGPEGTLYFGTSDGRLLALNPDGSKKWELELPARAGSPAVTADGRLYVSAAGVHCISPEGVPLWSYAIPAETSDPVLRADGSILAGARNGRLYALSPEGARLWSVSLRLPVTRPPVVGDDGSIYVPTDSTYLAAVSSEGRILWRFQAKQPVRFATLGKDGALLVGSEDWILYALDTASHSPAAGPWPQAYHDGQHTGRAGALNDLDGPAAVLLRELAWADSEQLKTMALQQIEAHLEGERYLAVHLLTIEEVLGYLAGEGVIYRNRQSDMLYESYPDIRREACRLLGELGSEGARAVLLQVMASEDDTVIRTAAVDALGAVGYDPDGELGRAILNRVGEGEDERFFLSCAASLYRLITSAGGRAHPDSYRALGTLAGVGVFPAVRERAAGYLSELARRWGR
jgi:outer membrane protein assembly factor BamB